MADGGDGPPIAVFSLPAPAWQAPPMLTPAEAEVARLALCGLSNAEIAEKRGRAVRTIANQLASIFDKLGISSRDELWMAGQS